jgi:peptide/nickel transport system substrate-binding protein
MSRKLSLALVIVLALSLVLSVATVVAQDDIPRGGTVVVNESPQAAWVRNFSPFAPNPLQPTLNLIYEPLVLFNPVEGGAPTFWLATGYEYAEDLMSITFTLREGVLWSDGETFNADDVVFTFGLLQANPGLDRGGLMSFVSGVEKVDDYTVTFTLSRVYTQADTYLGGMLPVPEHIWSAIEDPVTFTNDNPVSTGPFTEVVNFSEQVYDLCRNENYWQEGRPYVDCLRYPAFTGNDPVNLALINGEVDWAGNFVPDIDATFVAADPEHHGYDFWPGGGSPWQFYGNTTVAPFDDVAFRRAMSAAIDYQAIVEIAMFDYTVPASPIGLGSRFETSINPDALALGEEYGLGMYNPEFAAEQLDAAGYVDADGDGWRDLPDGGPIEFTIQIVNGWTDVVTATDIIAGNFQDVGINASMTTPDFGEWLNNLQNGTYVASLGWSNYGRFAYNYFRDQIDSTLINAETGFAGGVAWARWSSPETDALINAYNETADAAEQQDIVNQIQMAFVENVPAIPLFYGPQWYEYNSSRFVGWPTAENRYTQGSPWAQGSRLIVATTIHCVDDTSCGQE